MLMPMNISIIHINSTECNDDNGDLVGRVLRI